MVVDNSLVQATVAVCNKTHRVDVNCTAVLLMLIENGSCCTVEDEDITANIDSFSLHFYFHLYKTSVPLLFGLIAMIGLIGNSMVIWVILSYKKLQTLVNRFLLTLAFTDIMFLAFCVPFVVYHYAADNWTMGNYVCKLSQFFLYTTVYATVYTLVCVSIIRFFQIVVYKRKCHIERIKVKFVVLGIWIVMMTLNVPILFLYRVKPFSLKGQEPYYYCGMESQSQGRKVFVAFFMLTYVIPLSIIATLYILIVRFLRRRRKSSSLRHSSVSSDTTIQKRNVFVSQVFLAVVGVFAVCWLPLHINLLVVYFGRQPSSQFYEVIRVLCHCLAYSNSSMNPFIYHYISKTFRTSFKNTIKTCTTCSR